ncbi:MAG: BrnT family toxin [Pseudomonadota bacterium]
MFAWDEAKRLTNLRKHGIDFRDAQKIFRGFTLTAEDDRESYGERRFLTLGLLDDQVVSVAHSERDDNIRIISIRKATKHEARFYFSQITDRPAPRPAND